MKLERWAHVSEIVSGIVVVVTLILLVIGVRENTNVTQAAAYQDLLDGLNRFNFVLISDADLATLWLTRLDRSLGELEPDEVSRLVYMNRTVYRIFDSAYSAFVNGSLDPSQWQRFEAAICATHRTEVPEYAELWSMTEELVSVELASYLDTGCAN